MSGGKQKRRRAVRLTPEGLEALQSALRQASLAQAGGTRLTRERRADFLGVSVATAERIVKGQGVDRATLTFAFDSLNLQWRDSYCAYADETDVQDPGPSPTVPERKVAVPTVSRKRLAGTLLGLVGVSLGLWYLVYVGVIRFYDWPTEFGVLFDAGCDAYHRADFKTAQDKFSAAAALARRHQGTGSLADSLRMQGELAAAQGDLERAIGYFQDALKIRRLMRTAPDRPFIHEFSIYDVMADAELRLGRLDDAESHYGQSLAGFQQARELGGMASAYRGLGSVASKRGQIALAHTLLSKSLDCLRGKEDSDMAFDVRARVALLHAHEKKFDLALKELSSCLSHWRARGHPRWIATTEQQMATVFLAAGRPLEAKPFLERSKSLFVNVGDRMGAEESSLLLSKVGD